MNANDHLKFIIGDMTFQIATLQAELEEAKKQAPVQPIEGEIVDEPK